MNGRLIAAILALASIAVVIALVVARNNPTTPIDADRAAAAATSEVTTTIASSSTSDALPEGATVYLYDSTGYESIDALAGARHDYPPESYLTVWDGGCGRMYRWQAIEERWTSWEACGTDGLAVARVTSFNRWFGVDDVEVYDCEGPAPYLPPAPGATTWSFACTTGNRTEETVAELIGSETLTIGGADVDTVHVRFTSTLTGESSGGTTAERWLRADDGLLVRESSTTASASASAIGTVNYVEEYEITLRSLDPIEG